MWHGDVRRTVAFGVLASGMAILLPGVTLAEPLARPPVFDSLPGVEPDDPLNSGSALKCEQVLVDRARGDILPDRGPRYNTVNVCSRDGGPEFVSPRLPPSIYRQLRGFNY